MSMINNIFHPINTFSPRPQNRQMQKHTQKHPSKKTSLHRSHSQNNSRQILLLNQLQKNLVQTKQLYNNSQPHFIKKRHSFLM